MSDFRKLQANATAVPLENTGGLVNTVDITAARTLTVEESGTCFSLNAAAGVEILLPAVAKGLNYKFAIKAAFATTNFTIVSTTNVIQGGAIVNSVNVPAVNENTISFVATAETIGDWISVWSDDTNWYASGVGAAAGSITYTAP